MSTFLFGRKNRPSTYSDARFEDLSLDIGIFERSSALIKDSIKVKSDVLENNSKKTKFCCAAKDDEVIWCIIDSAFNSFDSN